MIWFQTNGQFVWPWFKKNPIVVALIGGSTISYMFIVATRLVAEYYGGEIWPGRFLGFATGMVFSINNTYYPYVNQEYSVEFLDPKVLNLSYQGPFWGLNDNICNTSAFVTLAFNGGFGQTACDPIIGPTGIGLTGGGPFDVLQFSSAFSLQYNPNNYFTTTYNLSAYPGSSGLVDIVYIQLSNSIYSFGDDLNVMDSILGHHLSTITLPGNTQSLQMEFNPVNNYLNFRHLR